MAKLDVRALGLSCGILWALGMLIMGILNMAFNWGDAFVALMSSLYIGFKPTVSGIIIGAVWGFVDAGIGGVVIAWLYNKLAK